MVMRRSSSTIRVRYAETDQMGVVYHANYLVWCEIGRTDLIRELGVTYARLEQEGLRLAVADARLRYHAPARYDELVRVDTWLEQVQSRAATFGYEILRVEPEPILRLVTATIRLVALDPRGALRTLPPHVLSLFQAARAQA